MHSMFALLRCRCVRSGRPRTRSGRRGLVKENTETVAYRKLREEGLSCLAPRFFREVEYNSDCILSRPPITTSVMITLSILFNCTVAYKLWLSCILRPWTPALVFIEMEDLLQHFHDPHIMDIKMGTRWVLSGVALCCCELHHVTIVWRHCRTFLESEVKNPSLRKDLYEKMIKAGPERADGERATAAGYHQTPLHAGVYSSCTARSVRLRAQLVWRKLLWRTRPLITLGTHWTACRTPQCHARFTSKNFDWFPCMTNGVCELRNLIPFLLFSCSFVRRKARLHESAFALKPFGWVYM